MNTPTFKFPKTEQSIVVWHRNGVNRKSIIRTPHNMETLKNRMIMEHQVGLSEIRAVMADPSSRITDMNVIDPAALARCMSAV